MDNFPPVGCRDNSSSKFIIERIIPISKTERTADDDEEVDGNNLKPGCTSSRKRPYSFINQQHSGETETTVPPSKVLIPYCRPSTLNNDKGSSDEEYLEDSSSLALVLSESRYEDSSSSVPPSASESETECDMAMDHSLPLSLPIIELSEHESVDQREPTLSTHNEAFGFQDLSSARPNGVPTNTLASDEISDVPGTSGTQIPGQIAEFSSSAEQNIPDKISSAERTSSGTRIPNPVSPPDAICEPCEASGSAASVQQNIPDTIVDDEERIVANIASGYERTGAVIANRTEDARYGALVPTRSSYSLPNALSIPPDIPSEDLRLIEIELLEYASHLQKTLEPFDEKKKELDMQRMQVETLLETKRTEYSAKKEAIENFAEKLEKRVESKRQCTEKREDLSSSIIEIKKKLDCKEKSHRDLRNLLFEDKMVALAGSVLDSSMVESREAEVSILNGEISKLKESLKVNQQAVGDALSNLKKSEEESQLLRTRISEYQERVEQIASELTDQEETFQQLSDRLIELEDERSGFLFHLIEIEKIISIIQLACKVRNLELKQKSVSVPNERLVVVLHDGQLLPQSPMTCFINLMNNPVQNTLADGRSYSLPDALSIPIETEVELLDQLSSEIRKYAAGMKEDISSIGEMRKELAREGTQVKLTLENQRTEYSANSQAIQKLTKKLEKRVEKQRQCTKKKEEIEATVIGAKNNLDNAEKSLEEFELLLFEDTLAGSVPDGPMRKSIERKKAEVSLLKGKTADLKNIYQSAQEAVNVTESDIIETLDEIQVLNAVISRYEKKSEQISRELDKNEETSRQQRHRWNHFKEKYNDLNFNFVELDKITVKIQVTRKLKKLETKQEIFSVPVFALHEGQFQFSSQVTTSIRSIADHLATVKDKVFRVQNMGNSNLLARVEPIPTNSPSPSEPIDQNIIPPSASDSEIVSSTGTAVMPPNCESGSQEIVFPSKPTPSSHQEIMSFLETFSPSSYGEPEPRLSAEAMDTQDTSGGTPIPHSLTVDWNSEAPISKALEPNALAGPSISDETLDNVQGTSSGTSIPDPVTLDLNSNKPTSEALEPSALAGQSIPETPIHDDRKDVGNDANTSSSCEPITTIATNITEVVRPGTSTQMKLPSTSPNPVSSPLDTVNEAGNELPNKLQQSAALPESRRRSQRIQRIRSQQPTLMIDDSTDEESFVVEQDDVPYYPTAGPSQLKQKSTRKSNRLAFKRDRKSNVDEAEPLMVKESKNVAQDHLTAGPSQPKFLNKYTKKERDRPHKCDKCNKAYVDKKDLSRHVKSRCGVDKPLSCSQCGHQFGVMDNLRYHLIVKHKVDRSQLAAFGAGYKIRPVYPNKCEKCPRTFKVQSQLNFHSKFCGLDPAFNCTYCSYRSNLKDSLKRHLFKIHKDSSA